ncbi:MAG: hypothetical protein QXF22_05205 [Thermoplasmata archaeon]
MGVWHLSGMGLYPGAVTVPLTEIYLLLKAASEGDDKAKKFFDNSGENQEERKGVPEALIIFTSKEVIEGKMQGNIKDEWFQTRKQESAPQTMAKYLSNLLGKLNEKSFSPFYEGKWIKYIHFVSVDHQNFNDSFSKCYITINALREKEIWINMVGGSNPINASLILSAGFIEANARTYYVFESNSSLLHPSIDKPDFSKPSTDPLLKRLSILPFFSLDLGKLTRNLNEKFLGREKLNISEIENVLEELNLSKQYLKKLKSGGWISEENGTVLKGEMLNRWNDILGSVKDYPIDYPSWKKWAKKKQILWNMSLDGKLEKEKD